MKQKDGSSKKLGEGTKNDSGKLRWDLLDWEVVEEIVKVYTMGANKYEDENWRKGIGWRRIFAALMRHLIAWWRGEDLDKESGLSHLAHAAWQCIALLWYSKHRPEFDDRYKKG